MHLCLLKFFQVRKSTFSYSVFLETGSNSLFLASEKERIRRILSSTLSPYFETLPLPLGPRPVPYLPESLTGILR